jgi:tetratricopeptide (TPR) repeat protein
MANLQFTGYLLSLTALVLALTACGGLEPGGSADRDSASEQSRDSAPDVTKTVSTAESNKTPDEIYQIALDGDYEKAIELLNPIIEREPNNVRALDVRAECYYAQKEFAKGIADENRLMQFKPSHGSYLMRGQMYQGLGRHDLAEKDYAMVVAGDLEKLKVHNMQTPLLKQRIVHMVYLANSIEHQNRPADALKIYDKILSLDKNDQNTLQRHANLLIKLNRPGDAITDYSRLIAGNPGEAGLYVERADCYALMKNAAAARKDYEKAKSLEPDLSEQIEKKLKASQPN